MANEYATPQQRKSKKQLKKKRKYRVYKRGGPRRTESKSKKSNK